jgi:hypothetical protein
LLPASSAIARQLTIPSLMTMSKGSKSQYWQLVHNTSLDGQCNALAAGAAPVQQLGASGLGELLGSPGQEGTAVAARYYAAHHWRLPATRLQHAPHPTPSPHEPLFAPMTSPCMCHKPMHRPMDINMKEKQWHMCLQELGRGAACTHGLHVWAAWPHLEEVEAEEGGDGDLIPCLQGLLRVTAILLAASGLLPSSAGELQVGQLPVPRGATTIYRPVPADSCRATFTRNTWAYRCRKALGRCSLLLQLQHTAAAEATTSKESMSGERRDG